MAYQFKDLTPLLEPKSIAVLGASERHGSAGRLVMENLEKVGYKGEIYPINPKSETVLGHKCYKSLEEVGKPIDMVAILIAAKNVLPTLKTMKSLNIPAAWVLAAGFSESGEAGKAMQEEISAYAKENGQLVLGPNCIGVVNLPSHSATYSVAIPSKAKAGNISVVMQSGAILMGLLNSARCGFRYLISAGNQAVLETSDFIGYLANDPGTKVICTFVEGIKDTPKFIAACRAARAAHKPIIMLKVGRSEAAQRAVQAHTGSLAGSDNVLSAVLKREGVIRVNSLDELLETAELFSSCPLPKSDGIGLLSLSGGQIGLIGDISNGMGLNFPKFSEEAHAELMTVLPDFCNPTNPLDAWGNGDLEKMLPGCINVMSKQDNLGLIGISRDTPLGAADREIEMSTRIAEAAVKVKKETDKGIFMFSNVSGSFDPSVENYLRENGVPYLQGTQEAMFALQQLEEFTKFVNKPPRVEAVNPVSDAVRAEWKARFASLDRPLTETESRELLAAYGIRGPIEKTAATADEAVKICNEIGYPVVMKILSPDIKHKTECGGVKVGLKNDAEAVAAFNEIMKNAAAYDPKARLDGVIIQEMIPNTAVEVLLGVIQDHSFGPVIVFGAGGILVELMKDSVLGLAPLNKDDALEMIKSTRIYKMLKGFRGNPETDIDALADALVNLSFLASDFADEMSALDINPLMVLPKGKGVCAVDALIEAKKK